MTRVLRKMQEELEDLREGAGLARKTEWKMKSNQHQFVHNSKILKLLRRVLRDVEDRQVDERKDDLAEEIASGIETVELRNKHLKIADRFRQKGWRVVEQYQADPLAADKSDQKRLRRAASFVAEQEKIEKEERSRRVGRVRGG